jgi:hypothetical protein
MDNPSVDFGSEPPIRPSREPAKFKKIDNYQCSPNRDVVGRIYSKTAFPIKQPQGFVMISI